MMAHKKSMGQRVGTVPFGYDLAADGITLEIAERCLDVHNDAGLEVPEQLLENLKRLRKEIV